MTTTNLGRVRFNMRGDYTPDADPLYSLLDLVSDGGGSFVYINDTPSNEPTSSASHWQQIASIGGQDILDAVTAEKNTAIAAKVLAEGYAAQLAAGTASPAGTYANLAALISANPDHSKIYITLDDGNWCYHNGSEFVAGGVYQAASVVGNIASINSQLADYAKYDNLAGDGLSSWVGANATVSVNDSVISLVGTGANAAMNMRYTTKTSMSSGKRIYFSAKLKAKNSVAQTIRVRILGSGGGSAVDVAVRSLPYEDVEYHLSGVFTQTTQTGFVILDVYANYTSSSVASGKEIQVTDVVARDLELMYGAGNEPTSAQMDSIEAEIITARRASDLPYSNLLNIVDIKAIMSDKFAVDYEAVEVPAAINQFAIGRLSLVATKKDNYYNADNLPVQTPQDVGYLYLDETADKLYYSSGVYNRPIHLFDWDATLAGSACKNWVPVITKQGDIIFLSQGKSGRKYPIVYPSGDYENPVVVTTTDAVLPAGLTTDTGACVVCHKNYVVWGEYLSNGVSQNNGQPMRIWKVAHPYTAPENWTIVDTWYYSNTGDPWGENPTREITHFHTLALDHYTGRLYANTGDLDAFCRVLECTDDGVTWTQVAGGGQQYRTLGYVFMEDACYWATDAGAPYHALYKATRNVNGVVDWTTITKLADLFGTAAQGQRTYNTCLVRDPHGLMMLDRTEPGTNGLLNIEFWSFDDNKLYTIGVLSSAEDAETTRYGFGNQACTYYQSNQEDGIICGSSSYDRYMGMAILNNSPENRLGVTKIKVVRK